MPSTQRADAALNAQLCHGLTGEVGITRLAYVIQTTLLHAQSLDRSAEQIVSNASPIVRVPQQKEIGSRILRGVRSSAVGTGDIERRDISAIGVSRAHEHG